MLNLLLCALHLNADTPAREKQYSGEIQRFKKPCVGRHLDSWLKTLVVIQENFLILATRHLQYS